jgi:hypothetical protein
MDIKLLVEMIEEMMDHPQTVRENEDSPIEVGEEETRTVALPRLRISEKWGDKNSVSRKEIEQYIARLPIARGGGTFEQKINGINQFVQQCKTTCTEYGTSQALSSLVIMEALSAIIEDYSAGGAGYLFEGFLAALVGGRQVKAGTGGIEDVVIEVEGGPAEKFSLKLFKGGTTKYVSGSHAELVAAGSEGMLYYVGLYTGGEEGLSVTFYKVVFEGVERRDAGFKGGTSKVTQQPTQETEIVEAQPGRVKVAIHDKKKGSFRVKVDGKHWLEAATLELGSRQSYLGVASQYAEILGAQVVNIYELLDILSKSVNKFFLGGQPADGTRAANTADKLALATDSFSKSADKNKNK